MQRGGWRSTLYSFTRFDARAYLAIETKGGFLLSLASAPH
jgi:hypothetical protein